jgi:signal transduction histidine kinase
MSLGDDALPDPRDVAFDQLRHDLKTPLTAISARAQLVARMVRRSSGLTELERGAMLDSLAAIEQAVRAMVPRIDGIGRDPPDGREDAG